MYILMLPIYSVPFYFFEEEKTCQNWNLAQSHKLQKKNSMNLFAKQFFLLLSIFYLGNIEKKCLYVLYPI